MAWGLSEKGFIRPNQAQIKEQIDQRQRELFGDDVNLSSKSPNGIFSGILSWVVSILWQTLEKVYHNGHVTDAEGVNLDYKTIEFNTSRNPEQYAEAPVFFTGTPNYTLAAGARYETLNGVDYLLKEDVTFDGAGNGVGEVIATLPGVIGNTEIATINIQSEPNVDVFTVSNTAKAENGRERETDDELRKRLLNSGASNGSGTPDAIIADVLAVPGVRAANITVNRSAEIVNGQPPHSNHVFALGGEGQDIANALFKNYTGLQFFGSQPFTAKDVGGNDHIIAYTPATAINVYVSVSIVTDNTFQASGVSQVKDAIVKLIGGVASDGATYSGLNMGDDVTYARILAAIMGVQGVTDATITIGTTASPTGTANIAIEPDEVAQINASDILVTL